LWQFREKDEDKKAWVFFLWSTHEQRLAKAMSGIGFLPEKMTTLVFSSRTGPTEES